jgi:TrmH family RNA methyltransferase
MGEMISITSNSNPKIKKILALRERRARKKSSQFLIEGFREIERSLNGIYPLISLFVCSEFFLGKNENALIEKIRLKGNVEVFSCSKSVFKKISYRDRPDGLLAIAEQKHLKIEDLEKIVQKKDAFILIAESIEKPGNLGTILRSSDAAGVDAVIVCDPCTDIFNPNVVRASIGTLFTQKVFELSFEEVFSLLKKYRIKIVATSPQAEMEYTQSDLSLPLSILVGTEQYGLSKKWLEEANLLIKIPMKGIADSLNVATATTLVLYEVLRQKK